MTQPFIGEIQLFGFNFNPRGWAFANGATLPISQNTALFSLLGVTYGGNGQTTFQLPNFAGRAGCQQGNGPGLSPVVLGENFGVNTVTLTGNQIPQHNHGVGAYSQTATGSGSGAPVANGGLSLLATSTASKTFIAAPINTQFSPNMIQPSAGGGQPHQNQQPYLGVNFCIALQGIYPSFRDGMSRLPPFPTSSSTAIETPAFLMERGFSLRHAQDKDIPRLRLLYADTRAEEMLPVPWPQTAKQQFLDQQFDLQHQHYLKHYADADFQVIERNNVLQGRYYLSRTEPEHLIIDICMMGEQRGLGIGRALIEHSQREAQALRRGMQLHVIKYNTRALALYEKLGFKINGGTDMHHYMSWHANADA